MTRQIKTPADSECFIAEIIGEESLIGQRMSAGKLFQMMDIAAASAGARHSESSLVTLSFDRIELLDPICHRDYVRYDAYVIEVGRSSMVIKVDGSYKPPGELEPVPGHSHIITMVAIDEHRKPNKNIPKLEYRTPKDLELKKLAEMRQRFLTGRQKMKRSVFSLEKIPDEWLRDYYHRKAHFTPKATELVTRRRFLPRNTNVLGNIFGGDTVEMMAELALATARQFTGNHRMVTIAMEDVFFLKPLQLENIFEMCAHVIFVANTTLVVEITVKAVPLYDTEDSYVTNNGFFTVLNYDRSGRKKAIANGLDMTRCDLETRRHYLNELVKYEKRTGRQVTWNG
ncbi:Acyl-CoA hydrolase [Desulfocicer vacuolatum DSM 3385]|uniref:Acyl-CoA hydrolase n=1 Tax=Desulfocicer vacuolatum DSM 3385 TaxID=1121400 RepID=A0A1W2BHP5_9BACT|nr:acyl-CoA thioesterase [Desulfocicer vacuolatum]SMC72427.1 Acyl-CoA hydrolase [Desulfocicer vacuolatum DSM 3385]